MAILTYEEYMSKMQSILGERDDEEALGFLQDTKDTFANYTNNSGEDWKSKYEENDAAWRKRYRDAFFTGAKDDPTLVEPPVDTPTEPLTFDNLFKEG